MFVGGAVHPAYRRRLLTILQTLRPMEEQVGLLSATQRQHIQDARDFLRQEQRREHFAPYNRTIIHIRNLERIIRSVPILGYEETKN